MLPAPFGAALRVAYPKLPSQLTNEIPHEFNRLKPADAPSVDQLTADDVVPVVAVVTLGYQLSIPWVEVQNYASVLTKVTRDVRDQLDSLQFPLHEQDAALVAYHRYQPYISGSPTITEITPTLAESAVTAHEVLRKVLRTLESLTPDHPDHAKVAASLTWNHVKAVTSTGKLNRQARLNLFMPLIVRTDDERKNWLTKSMEGSSELTTNAVINLFGSLGHLKGSWAKTLEPSPNGLNDVIAAMLRSAHHFDFNVGRGDAGDDAFLTAPSLVAYCGLGLPFVHAMAKRRFADDEEFWATYVDIPIDLLVAEVIEARQRSGCPVSLLLAPYPELQRIFSTRGSVVPYWVRALLALHLFKHCRIYPRPKDATWAIRVVHVRANADLPVAIDGLTQPFTSNINKHLTAALASILGIRWGISARQRVEIDTMIQSVLNGLTPSQLPGFADVPIDLTLPTQVTPMPITRHADAPWINIHMRIAGPKRIDLETGQVSPCSLTGSQVLTYELPFSELGTGYDAQTANTALDAIPAVILPKLPGETILTLAFRNIETVINGVDYRDELIRIINMIIVGNLVRYEVRGSAIGLTLTQEFPGLFFGSRIPGEKASTGQGKTTLARTLGRLWVPSVDVIRIKRSSGEVSQRASAMQLMRQGIIVADEFKVIDKATEDHWCDRDGMQSLMTGGGITVGQVRQNLGESRLDFSPIFSGKYFFFPQDIRDRLVPLLQRQFTPDSATTPEIQHLIATNQLAPLLRLQALLYIRKHDLVNSICKGSPGPTDTRFRFPGFRGVYSAMYGVDPGDHFFACISALRTLAAEVCQEARRTGGLARNRQGEDFQIGWHLDQWDERDIDALHGHCEAQSVSPSEALAMIVVGGINIDPKDARQHYRHFNLNAFTALDVFHAEAESETGITTTSGWRVTIVQEVHPTRKRTSDRVRLIPPASYSPPPMPGMDPSQTGGAP